MPKFSTARNVRHSAAQMFALVADIEKYPEFVPLCESLKVLSRTQSPAGLPIVTGRMRVAYKMLNESFTSRVELDEAGMIINVSYVDGPFKFLRNRWRFEDLPQGSKVHFDIDYEFRSKMLSMVMGSVFDKAFRMFAGAFEARADKIYGSASNNN